MVNKNFFRKLKIERRITMKKKILSILLAALMIVLMLPTVAFADETLQGDTNKNGTVEVYMTISEGEDNFYMPQNGEPLFHAELKVPYFDLALYGLEEYYYNPDCYSGSVQQPGTKQSAEGVVTTMHAFIYATEKYMLDVPAKDLGKGRHNEELFEWVSWSQGAGSSFMKFWNGSTNLNYFLDYMYPYGKPGWGSTSDQQALHDGSKVDIHLIVDDFVMGSSYSCFETEDGTLDTAEITEGESITLKLQRSLTSYEYDIQAFGDLPGETVYYISAEDYAGQKVGSADWTEAGVTDDDAKITLSGLEAGVYYVSCSGGIHGSSERGPAAFILTVNKDYSGGIPGDVDGDGFVTSMDASYILQYVAEMGVEINTVSADVDGDGFVTSMDASYILQYVAEIITEFPV